MLFLCCAMPPVVVLLFSDLQREGRWGASWTEEGSVTLPYLCVTTLSNTHPPNYHPTIQNSERVPCKKPPWHTPLIRSRVQILTSPILAQAHPHNYRDKSRSRSVQVQLDVREKFKKYKPDSTPHDAVLCQAPNAPVRSPPLIKGRMSIHPCYLFTKLNRR